MAALMAVLWDAMMVVLWDAMTAGLWAKMTAEKKAESLVYWKVGWRALTMAASLAY
jgi:hypothetical protein